MCKVLDCLKWDVVDKLSKDWFAVMSFSLS